MFKNGVTESQIIANLRGEFLEDARRRLDLMIGFHAEAGSGDPDDAFTGFKAEAHTLKGMGQSFGFPSITMVSRRLELLMKADTAAAFATRGDIQPYLDALSTIIDAGEEPSEDDLDAMLDGLATPEDDK